jgi:hypothetical protein
VSAAAWLLAGLVLTAVSPLWTALLSPLLLGAPHLALGAASLRRADEEGGLLERAAGPLACLVALIVWSGASRWSHLAGAAAVLLCARGRAACAAAVALAACGWFFPRGLSLALAHGHNLVGLAAWSWAAARAGHDRPWLPAALAAAGAALILGGALDGSAAAWSAREAAGFSWTDLSAVLAPGVPEPWAGRATLSFVFLQTAHYAAWIWGVPRALKLSWPKPLAAAGAAAFCALPLASLAAGPARARGLYLAFAAYHGWLELAGAARLARK